MGDQYRVVPQSLRQAQQSFQHLGEKWHHFANEVLPTWRMGDGDLGIIGRLSGVVQEYNSVVNEIASHMRSSHLPLMHAANSLNAVAADYEAQDEEYYMKFGWIERELDEVAPPPSGN